VKGSLFAAILAALVLAGTAGAATPTTSWARKDIYSAVKAIGYPKPHPKKLGCHGIGVADSTGGHTAFRCTATYTHHRRRMFVIGGIGEGGWLCAAKTLAGCKLLRKGFVTSAEVSADGSMGAAADLAARGYMVNHYGSYQATGFCKQQGSSTWACGFTTATVTLTITRARGGYVIKGSG